MTLVKKIIIYVLFIFVLLFAKSTVFAASDNCTREAAMQMAKILYHESGAPLSSNSTEDAFGKFVTAAIILNNASNKSGSSMYEKLNNLTNGNYQGYSSYKYNAFETEVYSGYQSKLLYICECVLNGSFTLPKNMTLQANKDIVTRYGTVWAIVDVDTGIGSDVYFGYEGSSLSTTDAFGNKLSNTSASYYKSLASNLMRQNYSKVNSSNVCNGVVDTSSVSAVSSSSSSTISGSSSSSKTKFESTYKKKTIKGAPDICKDEASLKAIYIVKVVIQILTVVSPAIIVLTSGYALFKAIMGDADVKIAVKNFITKFILAGLILFIPSLLLLMGDAISDLTNSDVNVRECWDNAKL